MLLAEKVRLRWSNLNGYGGELEIKFGCGWYAIIYLAEWCFLEKFVVVWNVFIAERVLRSTDSCKQLLICSEFCFLHVLIFNDFKVDLKIIFFTSIVL